MSRAKYPGKEIGINTQILKKINFYFSKRLKFLNLSLRKTRGIQILIGCRTNYGIGFKESDSLHHKFWENETL